MSFLTHTCAARFKPDIKLIKERIEVLIDKEFIKRNNSNRYVVSGMFRDA